jgi:hypothetical protein
MLCLFDLPALQVRDSQHVQRVKVASVCCKNSPIERFRLSQIPTLMGGKRLVDSRHGEQRATLDCVDVLNLYYQFIFNRAKLRNIYETGSCPVGSAF